MDHFHKLEQQVRTNIFLGIIGAGIPVLGGTWLAIELLELNTLTALAIACGILIASAGVLAFSLSAMALKPIKLLWQAILHIDPDHHGTPAPNLNNLKIGRELVTNLTLQIYQFASQQNSKDLVAHRKEISQAANIVNHLPLPLFVFNKQLIVTNASNASLEYCKLESSQLFGVSLFDNLRLEFPSEHTLEQWVEDCQNNKVTDTAYWERVHVLSKDDNSLIRQCDIAAYYNRDNPSGTEFIVTLFDRTERYNQDDQSLSFVALAVHELRTPLTMLRGYIEVFEEEIGPSLDTELQSFMLKMQASAKQLSSIVTNILNVARIDQNQLSFHLTEENWPEVLQGASADAEVLAGARGKTIEYDIQSDLPKVAVDRVSIYEVLTNLLENAVKYSGDSKRIIVSTSLDKEGNVQTTVQDFGQGIPTSGLPTLFEKFSRNHRTRSQVSGTGLGLYLTKAIITAHGGQVWASSKEGEGSTFGFTLIPYANLAQEIKDSANKEITRNAHGWIKNHSLYRR